MFEEEGDPIDQIKGPPAKANPELLERVSAIQASQAAHAKSISTLVGLYRTIDKTRRSALKEQLEALFQDLKQLGATLGVTPLSFPKLSGC